jgi:hypothetical protein
LVRAAKEGKATRASFELNGGMTAYRPANNVLKFHFFWAVALRLHEAADPIPRSVEVEDFRQQNRQQSAPK